MHDKEFLHDSKEPWYDLGFFTLTKRCDVMAKNLSHQNSYTMAQSHHTGVFF